MIRLIDYGETNNKAYAIKVNDKSYLGKGNRNSYFTKTNNIDKISFFNTKAEARQFIEYAKSHDKNIKLEIEKFIVLNTYYKEKEE